MLCVKFCCCVNEAQKINAIYWKILYAFLSVPFNRKTDYCRLIEYLSYFIALQVKRKKDINEFRSFVRTWSSKNLFRINFYVQTTSFFLPLILFLLKVSSGNKINNNWSLDQFLKNFCVQKGLHRVNKF